MKNQDSDALHPVRDNMGPADAEALGKVVKHYGDWSK